MRVRVDLDLCQGHGQCRMSAPKIFQMDEQEGQAYVEQEEVAPADEAAARLGARSCPERAITVE